MAAAKRVIRGLNMDEARALAEEGIGCIELCGAFGPDGARQVIEATGGRIPVGYVTHFPEQDPLFRAAFPNDPHNL